MTVRVVNVLTYIGVVLEELVLGVDVHPNSVVDGGVALRDVDGGIHRADELDTRAAHQLSGVICAD